MSNKNINPVKTYTNADLDKLILYRENTKSGIYRWNNLITKKSYIGSAINISKRFTVYYSLASINRKLYQSSSAIYTAILKYGYSNFSIDILEYCNTSSLIEKEQYYIDLLKPEYNILKIAYSRIGHKHTENTKKLIREKLLGHKHSNESILKMKSIAMLRKGEYTSFFGKKHSTETRLKISNNKLTLIKIYDFELNKLKIFKGSKEAAGFLTIGLSTLRRYKKLGKLIGNRYLVLN